MNPETNKFERFDPASTPRNWTRFEEGEEVILKNIYFTITEVGPKRLILKPTVRK